MTIAGRQGIDEAWSRLTPEQAVAAGITFIIGYVSEDGSKNLTRAEIVAYHRVGIAVLLIYEYSITAAEGGAAAGRRNAALAISLAKALGYPAGCALGFAIDEDETGHPSNVHDYAAAFTAICHADGYRTFVYGGLATVRYCADNHLVDLLFQTYAWSYANGTLIWDPRVAIRQVRNGVQLAGHDVDLDVAMVDDIGAWRANQTNDPSAPGRSDTMNLLVQKIGDGQVWLMTAGAPRRPIAAGPLLDDIKYLFSVGYYQSPLVPPGVTVADHVWQVANLDAFDPAGMPVPVTMSDAQATAIVADLATRIGGQVATLTNELRALAAKVAAAGHDLSA